MNIHEYQAKEILSAYGIPVPHGIPVTTLDEARQAYQDLGGGFCVVKAQIHAGGRGKAGGIKLCHCEQDVLTAFDALLGKPLITHQTAPEGQIVRTLYLTNGASIDREFYLSLVLDRRTSCISIIACREGGVDIESVPHDEMIHLPIHPATGIMPYHGRVLADRFGLLKEHHMPLLEMLESLYAFYLEKDAQLIEINPLVLTKEGTLLALDAKVSFDDNALMRHKDIDALRDEHEENPFEAQARAMDLNYIKMDGTIGCMVNGAGLAMATMDIINLYGEKPANFLDVGGGATQEKVEAAFQIILSDPHVKGIFVNIFGGIMRCDIIAKGIVAAAQNMNISVPVVVRLQGTNQQEGEDILRQSGLSLDSENDLDKAARLIVHRIRSV